MDLRSQKRYALFFICMCVFSSFYQIPNAEAARFSGSYLREICNINKDGTEKVPGGHVACQAYIAGVIDYHNVLRSLNLAPRVDICVPENVKMWDLHKAVLIFLIRDRTHDGFVASPAVTMALRQEYPCR